MSIIRFVFWSSYGHPSCVEDMERILHHTWLMHCYIYIYKGDEGPEKLPHCYSVWFLKSLFGYENWNL